MMKIIYVNNYGKKNTAKLRRMFKAGELELKYDRNSTQYGVKIYKVFLKGTWDLKAEFHILWGERQYNKDAHVWAFFDTLSFEQQKQVWNQNSKQVVPGVVN